MTVAAIPVSGFTSSVTMAQRAVEILVMPGSDDLSVSPFAVTQHPVSQQDFFRFSRDARDQIFLFDSSQNQVVGWDRIPSEILLRALKNELMDEEAAISKALAPFRVGLKRYLDPALLRRLEQNEYLPFGGFTLFQVGPTPSSHSGSDLPVTDVPPLYAMAFAAFYDGRLPTFAELQYLFSQHNHSLRREAPNRPEYFEGPLDIDYVQQFTAWRNKDPFANVSLDGGLMTFGFRVVLNADPGFLMPQVG